MNERASRTIVFAVDFSEMTDVVVQAAAREAAVHPETAVHAVCVVEPERNVLQAKEHDYTEELAELERALAARVVESFGTGTVRCHARVGHPAGSIVAVAEEVHADLIILGRHGHSGPRDLLVGSVPSRVLALAVCSVLVVQPAGYSQSANRQREPLAHS